MGTATTFPTRSTLLGREGPARVRLDDLATPDLFGVALFQAQGLNKAALVGNTGLEPVTSAM